MMDDYIKIGKSILDKYAEYAETETIDDGAEYFPTVKVIIEGIVDTIESANENEKVESILTDHVKQGYVALWIKHTKEDEEDPDIEYEESRARSAFDRFYYNK